jgi:hypothetical protein
MAILKFRVYFEEDDSVYRDVVIKHSQPFTELHHAILKAYEFDSKHQATFFRSNDSWQRGREISLEKYDRSYKVAPLLMADTTIGSEIKDPNQKFVYVYDFARNWSFQIELINVTKEESSKITYPAVIKKEGIGPSQYGVKGLVGDKLTEVEEKYDLRRGAEGFSVEGEGTDDDDADAGGDEAVEEDNAEEV